MKRFLILILVVALLIPMTVAFAEDDSVEWDVLFVWSETNYAVLNGDTTQLEGLKEYIRRYKEAYGVDVKLNLNVVSTADVYTKFPLLVAGGEIGDMIWWNCDNTTYPGAPETLYDDGLCVDITDMLPEYAPKFMSIFEKVPDFYKAQYYTPKGRLALFGSPFDAMDLETGYVEQLAVTGPVVPTYMLEEAGMTKDDINTFDDLTELLRRMKENGVEIPFHGVFSSWMMDWYYGGFGTAQSWFMPNGGDEVEWGPMTPEWREAVELLHLWYSEGLLNPDFANYDFSTCVADFLQNKVGVLGMMIQIAPMYEETEGNGTITALHMPRTTERYENNILTGTMSGYGYQVKYYATFFSTNCNDLEEAIRFIDFRYDRDMSILANFGIEGISFEYDENGLPCYMEGYQNDTEKVARYNSEYLAGFYMNEKYQNNLKGEIYDETVFGEWSLPGMFDCNFPSLLISRTVEEEEIYNKYYLDFMYYMFECLYNFVINGVDDASYDEYVQNSYALGYEELKEVQQAAYDRLLTAR